MLNLRRWHVSPRKASADKNPRTPIRSKASHDRAFIGTSGWAYTSWKPGFYPERVSSKKFFEYYATQLNSVEVNYTFRRLPTEKSLDNWLAAASSGFRFTFKAPEKITHRLRLKDCAEAFNTFTTALAPIEAAGRMGVVLFQLPPNFKADLQRLNTFLADVKGCGLRLAFEFRHPSWFSDETYEVLREHQVALCIAESDKLQTPDVVTAPFTCYRFRKDSYSRKQLGVIAETLRHRSAEGQVFAYFRHQDEPTGAINAVGLLRRMRKV